MRMACFLSASKDGSIILELGQCIRYFLHCYDKRPDRSNLSIACFGSQFEATVHHGTEGMKAGIQGGCSCDYTHSQETSRDEWQCLTGFLLFVQSGAAAHEMVLPIVRAHLPTLVSLV